MVKADKGIRIAIQPKHRGSLVVPDVSVARINGERRIVEAN